MLGPPKAVARQIAAKNARRAAEEQYAQDTLAATGLGGGIVSSQMLLDQMNGDDAELTAQRAAADREWTYGHIVVDDSSGTDRHGLAYVDPPLPVPLVHHRGRCGADFGAGWHATLEQIDEPAVRRKPLGFQRVDHQLP